MFRADEVCGIVEVCAPDSSVKDGSSSSSSLPVVATSSYIGVISLETFSGVPIVDEELNSNSNVNPLARLPMAVDKSGNYTLTKGVLSLSLS